MSPQQPLHNFFRDVPTLRRCVSTYVRMNRIQSPSFKYVKSSFLARTMTFVYERTSRLSVLFRNHCSILAFVVCCKKVAFELWLWKKNSVGTEIPIFNKQILLYLMLTTFAYATMVVEKNESSIWLLQNFHL